MKKYTAPPPTESIEQQQLFQWADFSMGKYPELALLFHIPNEGKRTTTTGGRMRKEGLRKGFPDLCLPVARGGYHSLYIELKRIKGSITTTEQTEWIEALKQQGHVAIICKGFEQAQKAIEKYLNLKPEAGLPVKEKKVAVVG